MGWLTRCGVDAYNLKSGMLGGKVGRSEPLAGSFLGLLVDRALRWPSQLCYKARCGLAALRTISNGGAS